MLKSPNILGFLKSSPTITVFFSLKAKTVAKFIEQNVLPSPLTDEVNIKILAPSFSCFLYKNCNEERIALKDSANGDFGFSKTAKLFVVFFLPTTPISGILVNLEISSALLILLSNRTIKNTITNGIKNPTKAARI